MAEVVTVAAPSSQLLPYQQLPADVDLAFMCVPGALPEGVDPRKLARNLVDHLLAHGGVQEVYQSDLEEDPLAGLVRSVAMLLAHPQVSTMGVVDDFEALLAVSYLEVLGARPILDFEPWEGNAGGRGGARSGDAPQVYRDLASAQVWGVRNSPLSIKSLLDLGHTGVGVLALVQGHGVWLAIAVTAAGIFVTHIVSPVAREVGEALAARAGQWALDLGRPKPSDTERSYPEPDDDSGTLE